jgi:hypothetical protein
MDDKTLKKAYRNAWLLTGLSLLFIAGFFLLTVKSNRPAKPVTWDMNGTPFVPAAGVEAEGYAKSTVPVGTPVGEEKK